MVCGEGCRSGRGRPSRSVAGLMSRRMTCRRAACKTRRDRVYPGNGGAPDPTHGERNRGPADVGPCPGVRLLRVVIVLASVALAEGIVALDRHLGDGLSGNRPLLFSTRLVAWERGARDRRVDDRGRGCDVRNHPDVAGPGRPRRVPSPVPGSGLRDRGDPLAIRMCALIARCHAHPRQQQRGRHRDTRTLSGDVSRQEPGALRLRAEGVWRSRPGMPRRVAQAAISSQ